MRSHDHTIILTDHECIAVSAAILKADEHGHRGEALESARRKLRASLDGHIARNYVDEFGRIHEDDEVASGVDHS